MFNYSLNQNINRILSNLMITLGLVGLLVGGFAGFLLRPSAPFVGQLPFEFVILRGANLKGLDQILLPTAQQSFNIMLVGAIIGAIASAITGYFVSIQKGVNGSVKQPKGVEKKEEETITPIPTAQRLCNACGKQNREQARFCGYCGQPL